MGLPPSDVLLVVTTTPVVILCLTSRLWSPPPPQILETVVAKAPRDTSSTRYLFREIWQVIVWVSICIDNKYDIVMAHILFQVSGLGTWNHQIEVLDNHQGVIPHMHSPHVIVCCTYNMYHGSNRHLNSSIPAANGAVCANGGQLTSGVVLQHHTTLSTC